MKTFYVLVIAKNGKQDSLFTVLVAEVLKNGCAIAQQSNVSVGQLADRHELAATLL